MQQEGSVHSVRSLWHNFSGDGMMAVEGIGGLAGAGSGTFLPPGKSWRVNCDGILCCNAQVSIDYKSDFVGIHTDNKLTIAGRACMQHL